MKTFLNQIGTPTRQDWSASLVVFIVAIPLSLGIALASGASPAAGILTAIVGGIVAGLFSGAPLVVTGPAAGLSALVFQLVQTHGIEGLAIITVLCGIIQVIMGAARTGRVFLLVPHPVLEGMLAAIGLMIVIGQLHVLAGAPLPSGIGAALTTLIPAYGKHLGSMAFVTGGVALLTLWLWPRMLPRLAPGLAARVGWLPAALPAVLIATLLSLPWDMPRVELQALLPLVGDAGARFMSGEWLRGLLSYIAPALGLAAVASAETLLTARAVDVLAADHVQHPAHHRHAKLNQELVSQGVANSISGIVGGLPMTGVMVRSSANVLAGAKTRWSSVFHGGWMLLFVGLAPGILNRIPLAALAAVLVATGWRLVNFPKLIATVKANVREGLSLTATAGFIMATDLLWGLVLGLGFHAAMALTFRVLTQTRKERIAQGTSNESV